MLMSLMFRLQYFTFKASCSQTVVCEGFSGGTQAGFLSQSKSFVNWFLCCNSLVCYADVANSFICYINFKYILSKLHSSETRGVHSNIKKHQVVHDLKKFENHCLRHCHQNTRNLWK